MGMAEYDHLNILEHAGNIHSFVSHDKFDPSDFKPVHLSKAPGPSPVVISPYRVQWLVHIQLMIQHLIVEIPCMDNHIAGFENPLHLRPEHSMGVRHDSHPYWSRFHYIIPPDTALRVCNPITPGCLILFHTFIYYTLNAGYVELNLTGFTCKSARYALTGIRNVRIY